MKEGEVGKRMFTCGMAVLALSLAWGTLPAQGQGESKKPAAPAGQMDMDAIMKAMAKYGTPGPQHKVFEKSVGKWNVTMKSWMDPAAPPSESKGTAEFRLAFGGRWLIQNYSGDMMGQPFQGMGLSGYDLFRQRYVLAWLDNSSTSLMLSYGTGNAEGTQFTFEGTMDDYVAGKKDQKVREVLRLTGPDEQVFEMYGPGPDGKEYKVMVMTYTRVK